MRLLPPEAQLEDMGAALKLSGCTREQEVMHKER